MHLNTWGLVLREVDYKESDKILTLFTEQAGKLTVSARGCRKKGSTIAAGCQLLVWAEFTLYEFQDRWSVKEVSSERLFTGIRNDLDKLALASYFAEVTGLLAGDGQPDGDLLALILNCLHALDKMDFPLQQVKTAFEWRLMREEGYEPQVECCEVCGTEEPEDPYFHIEDGGLCCGSCRDLSDGSRYMPLTPGALTAIRRIVWSDRKKILSFRPDPADLNLLAMTSEAFLLYHLDQNFHTLEFYKSLQ